MKRGQTSIILSILVVSIFAAGFVPLQQVSAYQALAPGDQLLYKNVFTFYEDLEQRLWHETEVPDPDESWWIIDHWDYQYDEMESYTINTIDTVTANVNYTWSFWDRYNNYNNQTYSYDYVGDSWILDDSYIDNSLAIRSNFSVVDYSVFDGILNLDTTDYFGSASYDRSEMNFYVINGLNSSYNVDVYVYTYADNINTPISYYDITSQEDNPYGWYDEYFVDSSTGFLLAYTTTNYDNYYASFFKNCATLGTWVDYYYNHTYTYQYTWQLYETTADYNPVADADLPGMVIDFGYTYEMRGDSDTLPIYFDLFDSWASMTVDVFLDGTYVESMFGLAPGNNVYFLYTKNIPVSSNNHTVHFIVYDDASSEHNTTWSLEIEDIRLDWPAILGPIGEYWYTIGNIETLWWQLIDSYLNPTTFEFRINSILDSQSGPWINGTFVYLDLHINITIPGDYSVSIYAYDVNGFYAMQFLTIHASDPMVDTTPPMITGPTANIFMNEGEDIKLIWTIFDENPQSFEIKINGTPYYSDIWTENSEDLVILLKDFDNGTWFFELHALDSFGNPGYASVTVYINEVVNNTTNPTDPTDPTDPIDPTESSTLTLDAPGVITTILSFISVIALATIIRKRK